MGDLWDSLLVVGARDARLTLLWPHRAGEPIAPPDPAAHRPSDACDETDGDVPAVSLRPVDIPTLAFGPPDAVDLLTSPPALGGHEAQTGASLRYWSCVAGLTV
ncbi:MAG: hypothetical protein ACE5E6_10580, partial [Phycisphaerae bacterium]